MESEDSRSDARDEWSPRFLEETCCFDRTALVVPLASGIDDDLACAALSMSV